MIIALVAVLCDIEPPSTPSFSASPALYISCSSSPSPSLSHTSSGSQLESTLARSMTSTSPPLTEPANFQSPSRSDSDTFAESEGASSLLADVDPQIIEALKSKDRIYVLKLGEQMESLINDRRCVFLSVHRAWCCCVAMCDLVLCVLMRRSCFYGSLRC
jgi:hypothetical protein